MAGRLAIRRAAAVIRAGGVVAYPTEAVWGLGCDPLNPRAVARILDIKQRPVSMGLILIASDLQQLEPWVEPVSYETEARIEASWPGPVSWLMPAQRWVPYWVRGDRGSVAVRITGHAQSAALCRETGFPIVSTSANRSGRRPARNSMQVRRWLGERIDFVLGGATGGFDRPSEIRDAVSGWTLRAG